MLGAVVRHGSRRTRLVASAVVAVVALGGVAVLATQDEDPPPARPTADPLRQVRPGGIPVREGHVHGAGTPLRDGLVVPPGTFLLGAVVPLPASPTFDEPLGRWWSAVLVVTGSPSDVVDDLTGQLEAGGADVRSACWRSEDPIVASPATSCALAAWTAGGGQVTGEVTRRPGRPARGSTTIGAAPASHLVLEWGPRPEHGDGPYVDGPPTTTADADTPIPGPWPDLPGPGDRLRQEPTTLRSGRRARLPAGTFAVGSEFSTFGAQNFLLTVRGDPVRAMDALARALAADFDPGQAVVELEPAGPPEEVEGATVRRQVVRYDLSRYALSTVVFAGGPTYLLVQDLYLD